MATVPFELRRAVGRHGRSPSQSERARAHPPHALSTEKPGVSEQIALEIVGAAALHAKILIVALPNSI